jgi:hypothetical protein
MFSSSVPVTARSFFIGRGNASVFARRSGNSRQGRPGVQVKCKALPLRFGKGEWDRMEADAGRYGWFWAVAAADSEGRLTLLDPTRAIQGTG